MPPCTQKKPTVTMPRSPIFLPSVPAADPPIPLRAADPPIRFWFRFVRGVQLSCAPLVAVG